MTTQTSDRLSGNAQVINRYAAAWTGGDLAGLAACYHDDFTLHYAGVNPLSGVHSGKAAALAALAAVSAKTNRRLLEVIDVMPGKRRSVIVVREAFSRGELKAELERLLIYTIKDDRLLECWVHDQDQALLDQFLA